MPRQLPAEPGRPSRSPTRFGDDWCWRCSATKEFPPSLSTAPTQLRDTSLLFITYHSGSAKRTDSLVAPKLGSLILAAQDGGEEHRANDWTESDPQSARFHLCTFPFGASKVVGALLSGAAG